MKKVLTYLLSMVMVAALAISSTVAYLQHEDSDVNVMTLGNVKIEQIEQERDANGNLVDFKQAKPAYPAVGPITWAEEGLNVNGKEYKVFTEDLKNVVDKIVTVKNTGKSDAYVRTIVAIEAPDYDPKDLIHINHTEDGIEISGPILMEINGVKYVTFVFTYVNALEAGKVSAPSLMQLFLDSAATNDDCAKFGDTWEVLVTSQAVQTEGFTNAATALNTAFDEITTTNHPWVNFSIGNYTGDVEPMTLNSGEVVVLKDAKLNSTDKPAITVSGDAEIIFVGDTEITGTNGIYVEEGATLTITGDNLSVKVTEGDAIGGKGNIVIKNLNNLVAVADKGTGIGGQSKNITIINTNIEKVQGGYPQEEFKVDLSHGKGEPEGFPAIGSTVSGTVITLDNVTIKEAIGGSKAAGIGARYWQGVTININNSVIEKVKGGNASAGIGGSRVSSKATHAEDITINIHNSKINATGGQFGAGIGSGYDTHCATELTELPITTINITGNSDITAKGGKYAAGIGTGFHTAGLAGKIEDSVKVNALSGDKHYKDAYTDAMNVGFGVVDPQREGAKGINSSFYYNGTNITLK